MLSLMCHTVHVGGRCSVDNSTYVAIQPRDIIALGGSHVIFTCSLKLHNNCGLGRNTPTVQGPHSFQASTKYAGRASDSSSGDYDVENYQLTIKKVSLQSEGFYHCGFPPSSSKLSTAARLRVAGKATTCT